MRRAHRLDSARASHDGSASPDHEDSIPRSADHVSEPIDVAILGGGPAGASAARLLANHGHGVTVLTRAPARPALAESLPPSVGKLLDRIGIRGAVDAADFVRATGNTVWWGSDEARVESFGAGSLGWQVRRDTFDALLLAEAERAGARVVRRAVVGEVARASPTDAHFMVRYDLRGRRRSVAARWILDCTGRAGLLARREWRRADPAGRTLALVGVWERRGGWTMLDDETHTLVESYPGGWAWSVPVSRARRYVTAMVDPSLTSIRRPEPADTLGVVYHAELAKAQRIGSLVRSGRSRARLTAAPFARDASSYDASRFADPGLLLVGDAASFVDPLSSYGIKKALSSAWLASVVVHTALVDESMQSAALELYDARERAMCDSLRRRFAELSRDVASDATTEFWRARSVADAGDDSEPDVSVLRRDPAVLAAFDELRRRASIGLRPSDALRWSDRPTVRGDRVELEEHLFVPAFRDGVRYLRSIDLVKIVALAPMYDQVPDLYAAYNRAAPPASLADFLGALSVLVGKGMLDLA
jgi:flavin-dependent dehydrogenase